MKNRETHSPRAKTWCIPDDYLISQINYRSLIGECLEKENLTSKIRKLTMKERLKKRMKAWYR